MEVLYRVWKDEGERPERLAYEPLKALLLHWVEPSEPLLAQAARIKTLDLGGGGVNTAVSSVSNQ